MSKIVDQMICLILESDEYLTELVQKLIAEGIPKNEIITIVRNVPGIKGKKPFKI